MREAEFLKTYRRQRTDSTHVLGAIRVLNRLETLGEGMRLALNSLAVAVPDWLATNIQPDWFDRYGRRVENYRLPKLDSEREALASTIGADGLSLLNAIYEPTVPQQLRQIPAVETLRQIWVQQFYAPEPDVQVKWRTVKDMPPSTIAIHSPHDVEAHYSSKRSVDWVGCLAGRDTSCSDSLVSFQTIATTRCLKNKSKQLYHVIHG